MLRLLIEELVGDFSVLEQLVYVKEAFNFCFGIFNRVRSVHKIACNSNRQVAADRSCVGFVPLCWSKEDTDGAHCLHRGPVACVSASLSRRAREAGESSPRRSPRRTFALDGLLDRLLLRRRDALPSIGASRAVHGAGGVADIMMDRPREVSMRRVPGRMIAPQRRAGVCRDELSRSAPRGGDGAPADGVGFRG